MDDPLDGATWFRSTSIRIRRDGVELHVDPSGEALSGHADFILLTHPHYDNFSEDGIARVRTPNTVVLAPASMKKQLPDADHFMRPGDLVSLGDVDILAVPAYNTETRYHPVDAGWLGYVFSIGPVTYYHAGDTDLLPSMGDIRCDVAFLPCHGRYTMGPEQAAEAGDACGAAIVVPIRWSAAASAARVERIAEHFTGEVRILERAG